MSLPLIMGLGLISIIIGILGLLYGFKSKHEKRDSYKEALLSMHLVTPESVSYFFIMLGVIIFLLVIITR